MASPTETAPKIRHHLGVGWATIAVAALFGLGLEAMHGLKLASYLDLDAATRRHMWTLAHAHGTLLGLLHLGLALTLKAAPELAEEGSTRLAARLLLTATLLMPAGFFVGGLWYYAGDPGPGILLVPLGGVALIGALVLLALAARRR